jgi:hypothetical protein
MKCFFVPTMSLSLGYAIFFAEVFLGVADVGCGSFVACGV